MSNTLTVTGNLGRDADLKYTSSGTPVLELSIADTPRKKTDTGWADDGPTNWFRASVWGALAEAIANSLTAVKGAQVTVTGQLTVREYEHNGEKRTSLDVRADTVGIREKRGQQQAQPGVRQSAPTPDPWATTPSTPEQPPW